MDLQQIISMKASIMADIEKQCKIIETLTATLNSLADLEAILSGESNSNRVIGIQATQPQATKAEVITKSVARVTPTIRVENVLNAMPDGFTRQQLFDAVRQDGLGELTQRDYASVFHRLKMKKQIKAIDENAGPRDCRYAKVKYAPSMQEDLL